MTLAKRYTLIALGIIAFIVLAPAFVFGVRGYIYDFSEKKFVQTGILVVNTEPKKVLIEASRHGQTRVHRKAGSMRFVKPGDYTVTVSKDGYLTWQKRLVVKAGLVTWAAADLDKLFLLPAGPKLIQENFNYQTPKLASLPFVYELERSPTQPEKFDLVKKNRNSTIPATVIKEKISAEDGIVYAPENGLIFVIIDQILYQVKDQLDYIASGVEFAAWDKPLDKLVYGNNYEINFYNPFDPSLRQRELLIRTSEAGGSFCFMAEIGYALRSYGQVIKAIELDGRDRRNIYEIIKADEPLEIISCDTEGRNIIIKSNNRYKTYSLR